MKRSNEFVYRKAVALPVALAALFLLLGLNYAQATNYFVAPEGNDSNPGTKDLPWKSIKTSAGKLSAGDTLFVRNGIWVETVNFNVSGTADRPIVISAYAGENAVIDGQNTLGSNWGTMLKLSGNYIHVYGLEVRNGLGEGVSMIGHHNKISGINTHHHAERGIAAKGDYSIVEYCRVWWNATNNCRLPGWPATKYPSGGWGTGVSAMRDPVNQVTDFAVLRGNLVYNNWGEGLSTFEAQGTLIEDNVVYNNWATNTYISDASNVLYQRNLVYTTVNDSFPRKSGLSLADERSDKARSANNTVINNLFLNADLSAFSWTLVDPSGMDNVLIANNTISGGMLSVDNNAKVVNKSAIIRNNIVSNTGSVAGVGDNTNVVFSNNLWSAYPGLKASGTGDVTGDPMLSKSGPAGAGKLTPAYFAPVQGSPAIDKGMVITAVGQDFYKHSRGNSPDIGAIEVNGPSSAKVPNSLSQIGKLIPNPAGNHATLQLNLNEPGLVSLSFQDFTGRSLFRESRMINEGRFEWDLPLTFCDTAGMYLVVVEYGQELYTEKLLKY
jgi:hypothetical protein